MKQYLLPFLMMTVLSAGPFVSPGQNTQMTEMMDNEIESLAPTPASVQLWTDKLA